MISVRGVLLDIDGTLVDSNDAHARAWADAFAKHGYHVSFDKVRSCIGTGGDKLIQAVVRLPKDDPQAQELSRQYGEIFRTNYLPEVRPFPGAKALVEQMHQRGLTLIVASSAQKPDAEVLLNIVGITQIFDHITPATDVDITRPNPDILQESVSNGRPAVM